ncbi:MAG TPA: S-layer homology domain-containing protein [Paenibacillaceae bacterium]
MERKEITGAAVRGRKREPRVLRGALLWLLSLVLLTGLWTAPAGAASAEGGAEGSLSSSGGDGLRAEVQLAIARLQELFYPLPMDDWTAFALARSGMPAADRYLPEAEAAVAEGNLRLVTDWARLTLAVAANGGDVRRFGEAGADLPAVIANHGRMTVQGPNAVAFALLALDAAGYQEREGDLWTRDALIEWLLENQTPAGYWQLADGSGPVDITAMVLAALAPYRDRGDVAGAVEAALAWLAETQWETGGFGRPRETTESTAQVLIALTSLGIDPAGDERFMRSGKSPVERLLEFRLPDGMFERETGEGADPISSLQALLGLAAVQRYWDGLPALYANLTGPAEVRVEVYGPSGAIAVGTAQGATALEVLVAVLESNRIPYRVEEDPQAGPYLASAAGYENGRFGGDDRWRFLVRRGGEWLDAAEGPGSFAPMAGDRIVVYYGDAGTAPLARVTTEPASPRAGVPFTVVVEKLSLDETGRRVAEPAAGVTVRIGDAEAVTDESGRAAFPALAAGTYTVLAEGYREDGPPAYIPLTAALEVQEVRVPADVVIEGDEGPVASARVRAGTALEAIELALRANRVPYDLQSQSWGSYFVSIGGIDAGKYGGWDGWLFAVQRNGSWILPSVAMDHFPLEAGDRVVLYYGEGGTRLVDGIRTEPGYPRPGEPVTVTVTYRDWDWEAGRFKDPEPLAGVTVRAGDAEAVTDEAGRAVLPALEEGVHFVVVSGYRPDGPPLAVRAVFPLAVAPAFADEEEVSPWAFDAVRMARAASLLPWPDGEEGRFGPQRPVTRAEFAAMLVRVLGLEDTASGTAFADVPADAWYAPAVRAAKAAGIAEGTGGGAFRPDDPVTREQAAVFLHRALGVASVPGASSGESANGGGPELKDAASVAPWAEAAVKAVVGEGWMTAYDGTFAPAATLTREQAAVIAARLYSVLKKP